MQNRARQIFAFVILHFAFAQEGDVVETLDTLIVEEFGAYVGKHSERLKVTVKGETKVETPLITLRQVLIKSRGVSVSSDAITACAERGIALHVVSGQGGASLYTDGLTGTAQTRRAQLLAFTDARSVGFAIPCAAAKLRNQMGLLMYHARSRKTSAPALCAQLRVLAHEVEDHLAELEELQKRVAPNVDALRGALLSVEGRGAQKYWAGVKALLPAEYAWEGRRHRGARDPINCALNYGYAILARHVEHALVLAGLDPFAGFVHVDRPGKTSLTFDLIEEFRQAVTDRAVLGLVNRNVRLPITQNGMLEDEAKKTLAAAIIARIEESGEPYEGKRHTLREIIQTQARHLAVFFRGDRPTYEGFVAKW